MHLHIKYGDLFRINVTFIPDDKLIEVFLVKNVNLTDEFCHYLTQITSNNTFPISNLYVTFFQIVEMPISNRILQVLFSNLDVNIDVNYIYDVQLAGETLSSVNEILAAITTLHILNASPISAVSIISLDHAIALPNLTNLPNAIDLLDLPNLPNLTKITNRSISYSPDFNLLPLLKHKILTYKRLHLHLPLITHMRNRSYKNIKKYIKKIFHEELTNVQITELLRITSSN